MPINVSPQAPSPAPSPSAHAGVGDAGFLLSVASARAVRNLNRALEPTGLRARSFSVLEMVVVTDGVTQRDVADALSLNPSQIVALVDELEKRELVERRSHHSDRRARTIVATSHGQEVYGDLRRLADDALDRTLRSLGTRDRESLHALLSTVVADAP